MIPQFWKSFPLSQAEAEIIGRYIAEMIPDGPLSSSALVVFERAGRLPGKP